MSEYTAPLRDIRFVRDEVLELPAHYESLPGCEEATPDLVSAILEEAAKVSENVLAPNNKIGDEIGCKWEDGKVIVPPGSKETYDIYREGGWLGLTKWPEYGGQGLPLSLGTTILEMVTTANPVFSFIDLGVSGGTETIEAWGTQEQKDLYLPKIISGDWLNTMCLTEPHCGSDLGLLRTRAEPNADGSYSITGTKIFITGGDGDLVENIIHIVLARLPDAPAGNKGISLFIVPKFVPDADGNINEQNGVTCGSIEHKMGIHASPTCVMNFDGAKGFLLGNANEGLKGMFTFMNNARLGVSVQGLGFAEKGFQKSLAYAKERLQMRSLTGPKNPDGPADPIIVHPDVRRLLLSQKGFAEGGRMLSYYIAKQLDIIEHSADEDQKKEADQILGILTPIAKAFLTETGFESANMALQCFGGHGYIKEWGVEQNVRDCRITSIYEGTTAIQALDLIARKILMNQGESFRVFTKQIHKFCKDNESITSTAEFIAELNKHNKEWGELVMTIGTAAQNNSADEIGAASVDFLMYSGYVVLAYFWAQAAVKAQKALDAGSSENDFYEAKIKTANFYFKRLLPRTRGYVATMNTGADSMMSLDAEHFAF